MKSTSVKMVLALLASFVAMFAQANAVTIQIAFTADAGMVASNDTLSTGDDNTFNLKDGVDRAYALSATIPLAPPPGEVWTYAELFMPTTGSPAFLASSQYTVQTAGGNVLSAGGESTITASQYVTAFGAWSVGISPTSANLLSLILPYQGQEWTGLVVGTDANANLKQDSHPQGGGYLELRSSPIPEPVSALLGALGLLTLLRRRR